MQGMDPDYVLGLDIISFDALVTISMEMEQEKRRFDLWYSHLAAQGVSKQVQKVLKSLEPPVTEDVDVAAEQARFQAAVNRAKRR